MKTIRINGVLVIEMDEEKYRIWFEETKGESCGLGVFVSIPDSFRNRLEEAEADEADKNLEMDDNQNVR